MASHPPSHCCTAGVVHEGTPKGELTSIKNIPTYISRPASSSAKSSKALLLLPDVIGHSFVNTQLIADQLAANGYPVFVPDTFSGDSIPLNRPPDFDMAAWRAKHTTADVDPIVSALIAEIKSTHGATRLGALGYCFGAKYVARFMAEGKGVDVGYMAHPSFVDADEMEAIRGPLSIAAAQTDQIFTEEKRKESEGILKQMEQPWQITLYSHTQHGFSVRGDVSDEKIKFAKEAAFEQAVVWFNRWL
ncbi:hypothetical protein ANO11243_045420 [Dothideomycetidae sp. 11243]|nr:hypothetical protein ANO11243_045420 [fungal sp. No.11243]